MLVLRPRLRAKSQLLQLWTKKFYGSGTGKDLGPIVNLNILTGFQHFLVIFAKTLRGVNWAIHFAIVPTSTLASSVRQLQSWIDFIQSFSVLCHMFGPFNNRSWRNESYNSYYFDHMNTYIFCICCIPQMLQIAIN